MRRLIQQINEAPIEKRLNIRTVSYLILISITILLWLIVEKQSFENLLFLIIVIISIGSLFFNKQDVNIELHETKDEIITKMAELIEFKDIDTGKHVTRVSEYTKLLATLHGELSPKEINLLAQASPLHDIGKIAVSDSILTKADKPTNEEWDELKTHPEKGYEIFKDSKKDYLQLAAKVSREHHEKWDGKGYPKGLKGEEISIEGRITAIADVFDALAHDRCYKKAWELDKVFDFFEEQRGKHFDPVLIDLFLENKNEFINIKNTYK